MVKWRRRAGASVMILGAAIGIAMAALASIAVANYVEWENGADALRTVAAVAIPPAIGGVGLIGVGRWIYGDWRDRSPVLAASRWVVLILGLVVAAVFGWELIVLVVTGIAADDQAAMIALGVGMALGLAIALLGFRLRMRGGRGISTANRPLL